MTASAQDDFYKILGISRDATGDAIKHGYRRQALRWHPDKHCGANAERAAERFKKVSEAYKTLSDPQRRAAYDRPGSKATHSVNEEDARVIWTKTFGWPGANISFGWIGPPGPPAAPARPSQENGAQVPQKHSQKEPSPPDPQPAEERKSSAFDVIRGVFGSMSSVRMDDEVRQRSGEAARQSERQADPQAVRQVDQQADGQSHRQSDRTDSGADVPSCRNDRKVNSTASMLERDAKMEFIMAEYRAGDLSEEEMKNLLRQM